MATKLTKPLFPMGLRVEDTSELKGVLNSGLITHTEDAVMELPKSNSVSPVDPSAARYNPDTDEFEGSYSDGWRALGGGGVRWEAAAGTNNNYSPEIGRGYFMDSRTNPSNVTLPVAQRIGLSVSFADLYGMFSVHPMTINGNGKKVYGATDPMTISTDSAAFTFTWTGEDMGWVITSAVGIGSGRTYRRSVYGVALSQDTSHINIGSVPEMVDIYINGSRLRENGYTLTSTGVDFNDVVPSGSYVEVLEYKPIQMIKDNSDKVNNLESRVGVLETDNSNQTTEISEIKTSLNANIEEVQQLEAKLTDPDSATKYSVFHISSWRVDNDIRGWGAKCDGTTDDSAAIAQAIAAKGSIVIPNDVFVTKPLMFQNLNDVSVVFKNDAQIHIDPTYVFDSSARGVLYFRSCNNISIERPNILGAKLDKLNAPQPWQDGDAGLEFYQCTGLIQINRMKVVDVKTWGSICVECPNADFEYLSPYARNCQVQSGIGGTEYRSLRIVDAYMVDIGLYGIESETRKRNALTSIIGGVMRLCNKGIAAVHNSDNVLVTGVQAVNCKTSFSGTSAGGTTADYLGDGIVFSSCVSISAKTSFELINPRGASITGCRELRDETEYFVRTRALDRIVKIVSGKAYVALDSETEDPGIAVNMKMRMDDGVDFTVSAVDSTRTTDPVFGTMLGFTTTVAMNSSYVRSSFRRYVEVVSDRTSLVLTDGEDVTITNNHFANAVNIFASYRNHKKLIWKNNTSANCTNLFVIGEDGTVDGDMVIESGDNPNLGSLGNVKKFIPALNATRTYAFAGGSTPADTNKANAIPIANGFITGARVAINSGQTTSGKIVLRINSTDAIVDAFSGTPLRSNQNFTAPIGVGDAALITLTDTVGDLKTTGYSVELRGIFM